MTGRTWALIVNPAAGRGAGAALLPRASRRIESAGHVVRVLVSSGPGHATELSRQARREGAEVVAAIGGDGTVHEVLNGLGRTPEELAGVALAIVPVGTGNSFLRDFGVPGDPDGALARALESQPRPVDVGHFRYRDGGAEREGLFLNLLGIGFIAEICHLAASRYKRLGAIGYSLATLQALGGLKAHEATVTVDGRTRRGQVSMAAVCNSQYTGGAMWIAPRASTTDGRLDLVMLEGARRASLVGALAAVFKGRHVGRAGIGYEQARAIEVDCDPPARLMPDGEVYGSTPVRAEVWPGALQLLV